MVTTGPISRPRLARQPSPPGSAAGPTPLRCRHPAATRSAGAAPAADPIRRQRSDRVRNPPRSGCGVAPVQRRPVHHIGWVIRQPLAAASRRALGSASPAKPRWRNRSGLAPPSTPAVARRSSFNDRFQLQAAITLWIHDNRRDRPAQQRRLLSQLLTHPTTQLLGGNGGRPGQLPFQAL